jgi:hypothetical protein
MVLIRADSCCIIVDSEPFLNTLESGDSNRVFVIDRDLNERENFFRVIDD